MTKCVKHNFLRLGRFTTRNFASLLIEQRSLTVTRNNVMRENWRHPKRPKLKSLLYTIFFFLLSLLYAIFFLFICTMTRLRSTRQYITILVFCIPTLWLRVIEIVQHERIATREIYIIIYCFKPSRHLVLKRTILMNLIPL